MPDYTDLHYLKTLITENRLNRYITVLENRTRYITVVLEDLFKSDNISACVRTCEAMGLHEISFIEPYQTITFNRKITQGSHHWVNVSRYKKIRDCIQTLRQKGYVLAATTLTKDSIPLQEISLDRPLAIIMGNELKGITEDISREADIHFHIPMYGFVQSFNVSVALAISLQHLVTRLHQSDKDWHLPSEEQDAILKQWILEQLRYV